MPIIYRPFLEKIGGPESAATFVGNEGELFYDPATTTLRISDGSTPGGTEVSGGGGGGESHDADKLTADTRTVTLDSDGVLTFNAGTARISTATTGNDLTIFSHDDMTISTVGGDDIMVNAGDRIQLQGGNKTGSGEGGVINLYAGDGGSDGGIGGTIRIFAGDAGVDAGGAEGGNIEIGAGDSTATGQMGGIVSIFGGNGADGTIGDVKIGSANSWYFRENTKLFYSPVGTLVQLGTATGKTGARGFITDSTVAASGNFGATVTGGGSNTVPVFSNGTSWLIG